MCLLPIVCISETGVLQKAGCRAEVRLASVLESSVLTSPGLEEPGWADFGQGQPVVSGRIHVMSLGCLETARRSLLLEYMALGAVSLEGMHSVCLSQPLHLILGLETFHQRALSAWQHLEL